MKRLSIFLFVFFIPYSIFAQELINRKEIREARKAKIETTVKKVIESKDFIFTVRNANPAIGPSIALNSDYDFKITGDSAYSYLPYFGEAYKAEYGSNEGGIKFENLIYNYRIVFNKKTSFYEIRFEIIEPSDTYRIYLNISSSGYGNLNISSNNRQTISYDGILNKLLE
ncbi:MAG: hypothetical protein CVU00_08685 [Bacteroidetes bacterium HGW-Bacteroidetes-17]|jgi:hypothetical protein|nr:MAG: hypothetical protein CVU00_08685 [Bacteroidetes bacterium HGW-Bacteroidetes-17]